jgi:putative transposase|tara:strand:+ start:77 stop:355 length:279 start_codon:yes stop_codon:yes gene_type:complete
MILMRFSINWRQCRSQNEKRYSEEQISKAVKQHEAGAKVGDIFREMGISLGTFFNWHSKYAGLEVNEAKCLKEIESENNKLKKILADRLLEV